MKRDMDLKRVHCIISGLVQGVYFRDYTRQEAVRLHLKGWVKNRSDGTVEAVFEGRGDAVDTMVQWLQHGSPAAKVGHVQVDQQQPDRKSTR